MSFKQKIYTLSAWCSMPAAFILRIGVLFSVLWTQVAFAQDTGRPRFTPSEGAIFEVEVGLDAEELTIVLSDWYCGGELTTLRSNIIGAIRQLPKLNALVDADFFDKESAQKIVDPLSIEAIVALNKKLAKATVSDYFKASKKNDELVKLTFPSGGGATRVIERSCMSEQNLQIILDQYRAAMLALEPVIIKYQNRVEFADISAEIQALVQRQSGLEQAKLRAEASANKTRGDVKKIDRISAQINSVNAEINKLTQELKALK